MIYLCWKYPSCWNVADLIFKANKSEGKMFFLNIESFLLKIPLMIDEYSNLHLLFNILFLHQKFNFK